MDNTEKNWYQFIGESTPMFKKNKWYLRVGDINKPWAFIDEDGDRNGFAPENIKYFDIDNAQNLKPNQ